MKNESYTATIELTKSPKDDFEAITSHVSKWWGGRDFKGSSVKLHDEFIVHHPNAHYSKQKLVEVIPEKKLVWLVTEGTMYWLKKDQHEWANTKMIFELKAKDNGTVLHFTHEGLTPDLECYALCSEGWKTVITEWLFNFIEKGEAHFTDL
ncbi:MAG TPA: SRPBCC domain-containing protein [Chitinophagaceae bacterium]